MVEPGVIPARARTSEHGSRAPCRAVLRSDEPSGLADMLHQFLEQSLADSPSKCRQAERLRGRVVFTAAEDESIRVCIVFSGNLIEVFDAKDDSLSAPSITADFLSVAHLTSGQESPLALLRQRKLKLDFSWHQLPFLLGTLSFMKLPAERSRRFVSMATFALLLVILAAFIAYFFNR